MNEKVKNALASVLKTASLLVTGIVIGLMIAEYGDSNMCEFCCQCTCESEHEPDSAPKERETVSTEPEVAYEEEPEDDPDDPGDPGIA